ncbi:hypothetical protein GVX81_02960 [[Haemophilus] felis]|uniref:Transporter n=1 Tax=[Haemophilus] felis TaxID=123822 RepID=A0A1T0BB03_9PAST|nr:hypothetical protein [[Haemophilus] felis]NBI40370.1 hypothetical protein [[Haemophilus] felis]OOS07099.1 hypothetical protein B0188_01570 [[Haemophilus] felis]
MCITLLFNVLAVITLTNSLSDSKLNIANILRALVKNPLILSILLGLIISKLELKLPISLLRTGDYLASITLPVALICAGDATTAANIIAITSLGTMFTSSFGLFVLKQMGWI